MNVEDGVGQFEGVADCVPLCVRVPVVVPVCVSVPLPLAVLEGVCVKLAVMDVVHDEDADAVWVAVNDIVPVPLLEGVDERVPVELIV